MSHRAKQHIAGKNGTDRWPAVRMLLVFLVLGAAALIIYAHTFQSPFVFDDHPNILNNPHIRITKFTPKTLLGILQSNSGNRPVANFSFGLNYFFHQYALFGYHWVNLLIHIFTTLLVFLIAREMLRPGSTDSFLIPFTAAMLWLVNPLHTNSVTYIVQRMNALSAMFYLLSLYCYTQARRRQIKENRPSPPALLLTACIFSGGLALASKEIAATLPVFIFLYEWIFFQNLDTAWLKRQLRWVAVLLPVLLIITLIYLGGSPLDKILEMYEKRGFTPAQRLLTEPAVIVYYLSLLFFPHPARLTLIYDFPLARGLFEPATAILSLLALLLLLFAAVYAARKNRLLSFAVLWFLGTLMIESSIIGLALIFEHRTYLPSVLIAVASVYLCKRYTKSNWAVAGVFGALIIVHGFWTAERNAVWADRIRLNQDCAQKNASSPVVYNNLADALREAGYRQKALAQFKKTIARGKHLNQHYIAPYNQLGNMMLGKKRLPQAIGYFQQAVRLAPGNEKAQLRLGLALKKNDQSPQAIGHFKKALEINPASEKAHTLLGEAYLESGRHAKAEHHFRQSLRLEPASANVHINLGTIYQSTGDTGRAIEHFQKALAIDPRSTKALNNLGISFFQNHRLQSARDSFAKALRIDSTYGLAEKNLEKVQEKIKTVRKKISRLKAALNKSGEAPRVLSRLGNLYARLEAYPAAIEKFQALSRLMPEAPAVYYNLACLYALQHQADAAVENLKKAVAKGYDNWDHLESDKDLDHIRETGYYQKLIKQVTHNHADR